MRVFLNAIYGQIFLNAFIIWRGNQVLRPKSIGRRLFILFFVIEILLYFTGYFFYKELPDRLLVPVTVICSTWFVASMYITMGLVGLDLFEFILKKVRWRSMQFELNQWRRTKKRLSGILIIIVCGLMVNGYHDAVYPVVRHLDIHIPKTVKGKESLTIVMMSDLHISETIGKRHVQRFVTLCNAEHPDLILIAGDMLDYESRFAEKVHIEEDLQRLEAPLGVYMTLGNHEYRANRLAKLRWLEKTGGILLVDSVVMPDSTFYLIGRDDPVNLDRATMETLMQGVDLTKPVIVFEHQPVLVEDLIENQCDLGLYGHIHNGQYWPAPLLMRIIHKYFYGYYLKGNSHIYVTSGVGFAGPPFRIGTRSEIVVVRLQFG